MSLLSLQQAIITSGGPTIVIPYLGLLIFGIILAVIGAIMPKVVPEGGRAWLILFWLGIILIIVWAILFAFSFCC